MPTFEQTCRAIALDIAEILIAKHKDYGAENILIFKERGLIVRAWDKISRLKHLIWETNDIHVSESLEDTWKDLAGYAIIGLMLEQETFTLPLEGGVDESDK